MYRRIFFCFSYGCEIWSFTVREEQRLRVQRKIFGPKRDQVTGGRNNYTVIFMTSAPHQILFG